MWRPWFLCHSNRGRFLAHPVVEGPLDRTVRSTRLNPGKWNTSLTSTQRASSSSGAAWMSETIRRLWADPGAA
jgi:hypothetical protein